MADARSNILLIAPQQPITFWSFNEALNMLGKSCAFPPLGLLTVAGMLPEKYELRLIDLNVNGMSESDLDWADCVITSSMIIHWQSLELVIARANEAQVPILCGGPLPTQYYEEIEGDATFFLGEAETGFLDIVEELLEGGKATGRQYVDRRKSFRPLDTTPLPRWDLIDPTAYSDMLLQITRGCPESCTFCNIPALYGKTTRLKQGSQTLRELQAIYDAGWRGAIMAVDDNFIGNREAIKRILREEIMPWQKERGYPFQLYTQASVRMSEDPDLLEAMHGAGFDHVFCGIETPVEASLKFMGAQKNLHGDVPLLEKVKTLQRSGFEVSAGFIVGLDTDPEDVAERMIEFIQEAAIPVAMVGILGVLRDTPDYKRFSRAGRLVEGAKYSGDSGLFRKELSFVPAIEPEELFRRHRKIVTTIHSPGYYFERARKLVLRLGRKSHSPRKVGKPELTAAVRSVWTQGIVSDYRRHYWRLLLGTLVKRPARFPLAFRLAIQGHHMVTVTRQAVHVARLTAFYEEALSAIEAIGRGAKNAIPKLPRPQGGILGSVAGRLREACTGAALKHNADVLLTAAQKQISQLKGPYRPQAHLPFRQFRSDLQNLLHRYGGADIVLPSDADDPAGAP